jgi:hypothetical protein
LNFIRALSYNQIGCPSPFTLSPRNLKDLTFDNRQQEPKVILINSLCTVIKTESIIFFACSKPSAEVYARPHIDQFRSVATDVGCTLITRSATLESNGYLV